MKYILLIILGLSLTGCASLSAGLTAMGNGLSQRSSIACNTSNYGTTSSTQCQ